MTSSFRVFLFLWGFLTATTSVWAWGTQGHQVVAMLAEAQISPKSREAVARLLALEPGATLASISTWADEHRNQSTALWHYVNFPRDSCIYQATRDCPDGNCVVGAIDKQMGILASSAPDTVRLLALKYVVHFVGDVHQPLHAGYVDDRGGNSYQLQAFGRGTNLHAVWDVALLRSLEQDTAALAGRLRISPIPSSPAQLNAARFAEESCRIVGMPGFYPGRRLEPDYLEQFTPIVEQRLALAGARLAGLLNQALR